MSNRLAGENSPYLLQHADNPVDWYPWGSEALEQAREEDKPIFLSVGYAACHWCHVMEHESFEDPDTAAIMNEHFINIKVDREERPDIDSLYMDAVVSLAGQGGWPMSVFLTPEGKPFYGGTYFPPEPRHRLPSFRQVLQSVSRAWVEDREQLLNNANALAERMASIAWLQPSDEVLNADAMQDAAETLFRLYDWTHGGWGGAPKFPAPMVVEFLLRTHHRRGDALARDMAAHALASMARGGIRDHLAGGFHRYAVDRTWLVPHFEKMLYDNALLSQAYLNAWQVTGETQFLEVAQETLHFLLVDMRHPEGGFYSSIDADSEGEEGRYYVWTLDELRSMLTEEAQYSLFTAAYGAT
ncbi:MAG TPA: thioredoxin domain-containing protein, partial [Anaerolineae bacterium]|nr:thioredoxin domain-containing protein [Anaerolineae bacterium]